MGDKKSDKLEKRCFLAKKIIDTVLVVTKLLKSKKLSITEKEYAVKHVIDVANFEIYKYNNKKILQFKKGGIVGCGNMAETVVPVQGPEYIVPTKQMFDLEKIHIEIEKTIEALNG